MSEADYPDPVAHRFITAGLMASALMNSLDTTIANVALPHMQGSVSASQAEITWVLTSYIIAGAVCIPLSGYFANRFGRKTVLLIATVGFTLASMLCGFAQNLGELVLFRMMQGAMGAPLIPMSQAILLDINPPAKQPGAMAVWGLGAILGPILGPVVGGWLTDALSWRWVFFVNVPFGILSTLAVATFLEQKPVLRYPKFDFMGFFFITVAIISLQLMLDRGQQLDWFSSTEICLEAAVTGLFFYAFVVHLLTAPEPFMPRGMFRDRNLMVGASFGLIFGVLMFGTMALLPVMLEQYMGYPVITTGLVTAPRGVGTLVSMLLVGRLIRWVDARLMIAFGFAVLAAATWMMVGFSLEMGVSLVLLSGILAGLGNGFTFAPLSTIAFSTISPKYRNDATSMYTLIRNIGAAAGISLIQAITIRANATVHSRLIEGIRPDNPVLALRMPDFDFNAPAMVAQINGMISRQAGIVSYIDVYWMLSIATLLCVPFVYLMKPLPRNRRPERSPVHIE